MAQQWSGSKTNYRSVPKNRRRSAATKAGPVIITRKDGSVEVKPAYKPGMVHHINRPYRYDEKGKRLPDVK